MALIAGPLRTPITYYQILNCYPIFNKCSKMNNLKHLVRERLESNEYTLYV